MKRLGFGVLVMALFSIGSMFPHVGNSQSVVFQRPLTGSNFSSGVGYGTALPTVANNGADPGDGELYVLLDATNGPTLQMYDGVNGAWREVGGIGAGVAADYFSAGDNIGFRFTSDPDSGVDTAGPGTLAFIVNNNREMLLGNNFLQITNAPGAIGTEGDSDTLISFPGSNGITFQLGGEDGGTWYVAKGALTPTQMQTLFATPIGVIAAPGAGNAIVVESVQFHLDYVSAAYDDDDPGEDLVVEYESGTNILSCDNATCLDIDAAADAYGYVNSWGILGRPVTANEGVDITLDTGEVYGAAGDSPVRYLIRYRIIAVDLS